ncbi:MAG: thiamine-phosphate kinase [Arachnia sp.]
MASEFELIRRLTQGLEPGPSVLLGPGDDAAVLRPDGDIAVTCDLLVENVHFKRQWSSGFDVGRKAVAVNVSDVEAMGAAPSAIVVGLGVPRDLGQDWIEDFGRGVREEAGRAGVSLVGGDLSSAAHITVCVTAHGNLQGRRPVTRSGAQPDDQVAVAGHLGWSGAGLAVLQRGFSSPAELVAEHRCPQVPYGQGRRIAEVGATAMCDVSDGLIADLGHISNASGVGIDVASASLVGTDAIARVAAATNTDPLQYLLAGGEDHALVATLRPDIPLPQGWTSIGTVIRGSGITVDGQPFAGRPGWDHFRSIR